MSVVDTIQKDDWRLWDDLPQTGAGIDHEWDRLITRDSSGEQLNMDMPLKEFDLYEEAAEERPSLNQLNSELSRVEHNTRCVQLVLNVIGIAIVIIALAICVRGTGIRENLSSLTSSNVKVETTVVASNDESDDGMLTIDDEEAPLANINISAMSAQDVTNRNIAVGVICGAVLVILAALGRFIGFSEKKIKR